MGLDQYAWALDTAPKTPVDTGVDDDGMITDAPYPDCFRKDPVYGTLFVCKPGFEALAYWRKHPNLHGFIQAIYTRKGGTQFQLGSFHGDCVLDLADIEAIEEATRKKTLPHTEGFFFGKSFPEDDALTLEFCRRARAAIEAGKTVLYTSSW